MLYPSLLHGPRDTLADATDYEGPLINRVAIPLGMIEDLPHDLGKENHPLSRRLAKFASLGPRHDIFPTHVEPGAL